MNARLFVFGLRKAGGALLIIAAVPLWAQAPADISPLLDRITARNESFNPKSSWTASVTSTQIETDRKWNPEKTIVQSKAVTVTEGRREENVLKVVETKDGKTTDVTERVLAEHRARHEKSQARRPASPEPPPRKPAERNRGRLSMRTDLSELLPFSPERRTEFSFQAQETTDGDGRRLVFLDVRAKVKDPMNFEGRYTIDAATGAPIRARLTPSENPSMVKELEVEADFEVLEDIHFIPKRTRIKVNAGFLFIKRVHIISEEVYTDIRITR
jgi:hypothetical protein